MGTPEDRLRHFLYVLMRDHLPAGRVEEIVAGHIEPSAGARIVFSSPGLAAVADDLAARISPGAIEREGIAEAARTVLEEVERDLPGRCLICAMSEDDGHTPDCPIPSLRAWFRALDGGS